VEEKKGSRPASGATREVSGRRGAEREIYGKEFWRTRVYLILFGNVVGPVLAMLASRAARGQKKYLAVEKERKRADWSSW
jgi:hypothetical protein